MASTSVAAQHPMHSERESTISRTIPIEGDEPSVKVFNGVNAFATRHQRLLEQSVCPSQNAARQALAGLLTPKLFRLRLLVATAATMAHRTSRTFHLVTAAGPSRIRTEFP